MIALVTVIGLVTTLTPRGPLQEVRDRSGFAMTAPQGWHRMTTEGIADNLGNVKLGADELRKLLANFSTSTVVATYIKYQPTAHAGLIPKVQVDLRRSPAKTFDAFFKAIVRSTGDFKAYFPDFELTGPAREVLVGGRRAVLFTATYSLEMKNAGRLNVRTRTYAVLSGQAFFQISLTDGPSDDCSATFDAVVETIRFD